MRAPNSIDNDLLMAAKVQAEREHRSLEDVLSEFARHGLLPRHERKMGRVITSLSCSEEGKSITSDIVRELRD